MYNKTHVLICQLGWPLYRKTSPLWKEKNDSIFHVHDYLKKLIYIKKAWGITVSIRAYGYDSIEFINLNCITNEQCVLHDGLNKKRNEKNPTINLRRDKFTNVREQ